MIGKGERIKADIKGPTHKRTPLPHVGRGPRTTLFIKHYRTLTHDRKQQPCHANMGRCDGGHLWLRFIILFLLQLWLVTTVHAIKLCDLEKIPLIWKK